jgi:O-methyltransferase domain
MPPTARLLLVETIIPPGNQPSFGKLTDVAMLVWTGGRERTEAEYGALLAAADFELTQVVPTRSSLSVLEAVPR